MTRLQANEANIRNIAERNGDYLVNATDLVELFDRIRQLEALVPHSITHGNGTWSFCCCGARIRSTPIAITNHLDANTAEATTDPHTGAFDNDE